MKCRYCGNNLGFEDELCPHCGNVNAEAAGHIAVLRDYKEDYDNTKRLAKKKRWTSSLRRWKKTESILRWDTIHWSISLD